MQEARKGGDTMTIAYREIDAHGSIDDKQAIRYQTEVNHAPAPSSPQIQYLPPKLTLV